MKFEKFPTRFDILMQKRYESDLVRPEIETQIKRYPIDPKLNMQRLQEPGTRFMKFELIRS